MDDWIAKTVDDQHFMESLLRNVGESALTPSLIEQTLVECLPEYQDKLDEEDYEAMALLIYTLIMGEATVH